MAGKSPRPKKDKGVKSLMLRTGNLDLLENENEQGMHRTERMRLDGVLSHLGPNGVFRHLVNMLSDADMHTRVSAQQGLSMLFPKTLFPIPDIEAAHCARCHHTYDPQYNFDGDCRVVHSESSMYPHEQTVKTSSHTGWKLACCQKEAKGAPQATRYTPKESDGFCYKGKHVSKDSAVGWYNNISILTCQKDKHGVCRRPKSQNNY